MIDDLVAQALRGAPRTPRELHDNLRQVGLRIVVDDAHLASEAKLFSTKRDPSPQWPPVETMDV